MTFDEQETRHRTIIGAEYYEPLGISAETTIERVFAFLLMKKIPRHTEGALCAAAAINAAWHSLPDTPFSHAYCQLTN